MSRKTLVFHSVLTPTVLGIPFPARSIKSNGHYSLFLASVASEHCLVKLAKNTFRLRKRRYYRNDFARQFYARFMPEAGGTRIESYFDVPRLARFFMRAWLGRSAHRDADLHNVVAGPYYRQPLYDRRFMGWPRRAARSCFVWRLSRRRVGEFIEQNERQYSAVRSRDARNPLRRAHSDHLSRANSAIVIRNPHDLGFRSLKAVKTVSGRRLLLILSLLSFNRTALR